MMTSDNCNKTDREMYPLLMGYLPPEFVKKSETELHETPETRKEGIQQIRRLLRGENGINDEWFSDDVIVTYLRGRKYRIQDVFSAMKRMIAFINKNDVYFKPLKPDVTQKCWECEYVRFSPVRSKDGCVIVIFKLCNWNPAIVQLKQIINFVALNYLRVIADPMTQVNGFILLYDFKDTFNTTYLPFMTPTVLKTLYDLYLESMPVRIKAAHILNPNKCTRLALSFVLRLVSEKIKRRVFVHDKVENVINYVNPNAVPSEYGGNVLPHQIRYDWMKTTTHPDYVLSIVKSKKSTR